MAFELTAESAGGYLRARGGLAGVESACLLGGGVSNTVVLVEGVWAAGGRARIVLKQSLPQLRVRDEWLADRARIFRERDAILVLTPLLPKNRLPRILFADDANYIYAMEAAPPDTADWKTLLLAGVCDRGTARQAGATLGLAIRETWGRDDLAERFGDRRAFEQLRTDPYYRAVGRRHPTIRPAIEEWIAAQRGRRNAMVHGDWSPKNLLISAAGLTAIDFECAHFGDPSYDAAFLTNHLLLKAFHRPRLAGRYCELARTAFNRTAAVLPREALAAFEADTARHLAFLLLARIDGKSPVEYIVDERTRERIRLCALRLIADRPETLTGVLQRVESALEGNA